MSSIKIKRSGVNGAPGSLEAGELAYSFLTGTISNGGDRLYFGSGSAIDVIGGKYFTEKLDHTPGTLTASSAIIVDSSSKIDNLKVDNLDFNGNTISVTNANGNLILLPNGTGVLSVSGTTNYEANVVGDDDIPNKKYVDDAIATVAASTDLEIAGDTGTETVAIATDTVYYVSGVNDGLTVSVTRGIGGDSAKVYVTSNLDQALATTSSPQFASLTLTGDLAVNGGDITTTATTFNLLNTNATTVNFGSAATTISIGSGSGTATFNNHVVITGDLTVNGDTVTVNTTTLSVEDPLIRLGTGNTANDALDMGFIGSYGASGEKYAGFFRDATNSQFYIFNGAPTSALASNVVDRTAVGFALAKINADEFIGMIDGGTY